jgi:hypothetical protein
MENPPEDKHHQVWMLSIRPCSRPRILETLLAALSLLLAIVHTWISRYSMDPDGVSYLDVGTEFFHRHWSGAFNAYWSPLYAWILGMVIGIAKPSPRSEFPLAHLVNFGIFVAVLAAFHFLLSSLLLYRQREAAYGNSEDARGLPDWSVILVAYAIFWWVSFEVVPLYLVGPDFAACCFLYIAFGLLLRARLRLAYWNFVGLGVTLGLAYWTKAALFLVSFVLLASGWWWARHSSRWVRGMAIAFVAFLATCAPLISILSLQKHRLTFGDSGRLNYAWFVSPAVFWRNWQGEPAGSGKPLHPTQQLSRNPRVFAFEGPTAGTYPPWFDPSYWNEGLKGSFSVKAQSRTLATTLPTEAALLLRAQPGLLTGILILAGTGGALWLVQVRNLWPLVVVPLAAYAMYALVHVEGRFLGGFTLVLFATLLAASRVRSHELRPITYVALAVFLTMGIGTVDTTLRFGMHRLAIPGNGPNSQVDQIAVAEQIRQLGVSAGDRVAIIGNGTGAYWAQLAGVHIIAEIMESNNDAQQFWQSSEETRDGILLLFAGKGAKLIVADSPPTALTSRWARVPGTTFYVLPVTSIEGRFPVHAPLPARQCDLEVHSSLGLHRTARGGSVDGRDQPPRSSAP